MMIGKLSVEIRHGFGSCAILPNGDGVSLPAGCENEQIISDLVHAYLQGMHLAFERLTNQGEKSPMDIFYMRQRVKDMWSKSYEQ